MSLKNKSMLVGVGVGVLLSMYANAADDSQPEMWDEPSHQLVFERGDTRILEVRIVPGATSEFHKHRFATVYVILQDAQLQAQEDGEEWTPSVDRPYRPSGSVMNRSDYVLNNSFHRVKSNDEVTFHLIAVVNSAAATGAEFDANDGSPVNNDWFAEHRFTLGPGERTEQLQFSNEVVLVQSGRGSAFVLENGIKHSFRNMPGAWSWHAHGSRFQVVNDGDEGLEFVLIEVRT